MFSDERSLQAGAIPITFPLQRHTHTYDLMRQCIHCGLCLPTCPTYSVLGGEMDSPRGRIYQMQAVAEGRLEVSDEFVEHINCCVGCRACETACPSGVQFGKLIEAAREHIQLVSTLPTDEESPARSSVTFQRGPLPVRILRRFFFAGMLPSRLVLSLVFGGLKLYQRSGLQKLVHTLGLFDLLNRLPTPFRGKLAFPEALMDGVGGDIVPRPLLEVTPALGTCRYRVGFLSGCIMDQVYRNINEATIRVLAANGCEVITPSDQSCCGALHIHGGEAEHGRALARRTIDVFERYECDAIIINSAGCGSTMKEYDHLLRDDPVYAERAKTFSGKVKDISEFLVNIGARPALGRLERTIAYHDACHLIHGQKIKQQPRQLLQAIPGLTLVDLKESDWCCGSAGVYNITNQEMAQQLLDRKMKHVAETGASVIATGNPGCLMQIALGVRQQGLSMEVVHPVQLLDEAYRVGGLYRVPERAIGRAQRRRQAFWLGVGLGLIGGLLLFRRRRK